MSKYARRHSTPRSHSELSWMVQRIRRNFPLSDAAAILEALKISGWIGVTIADVETVLQEASDDE